MKKIRLLLLGFALMVPLLASAQWQWLDQSGKKVFSDKAPPPDVPEKSILHRPGAVPPRISFSEAANTPGAAEAPSAPATSSLEAPPLSAKGAGVDKELEEKTKKLEAAEKAKLAEEAAKVAKSRADNCARARQGKATMDSGIRVARLNEKGEREVMDDKARATEQQRLQSVISSDCSVS